MARDLGARGVPTHQRTMGRSFRDFVALTALARADDEAWCERLRAQGGIVLMCDRVQFEDRSPALCLAWDALSGEPLFGERKLYRGKEDLVPLLEGVRDMDVPVIGIVTDKQKGLVPAAKDVFSGVPYPSCHSHLLRSCAKPLEPTRAHWGKPSAAGRTRFAGSAGRSPRAGTPRPRARTRRMACPSRSWSGSGPSWCRSTAGSVARLRSNLQN